MYVKIKDTSNTFQKHSQINRNKLRTTFMNYFKTSRYASKESNALLFLGLILYLDILYGAVSFDIVYGDLALIFCMVHYVRYSELRKGGGRWGRCYLGVFEHFIRYYNLICRTDKK